MVISIFGLSHPNVADEDRGESGSLFREKGISRRGARFEGTDGKNGRPQRDASFGGTFGKKGILPSI